MPEAENRLYQTGDFERASDPPERPGVGAEPYRSPARRDKARLIHSAAFRRLQGKTQLFPGVDSDFFRNRLTHSLEVAQVAESIAHKLNDQNAFLRDNPIDPEICLVAGLAHDLGHPPFGHNGETALDDLMKCYGGFEGNAQTFRILTRLEKKEARNALPVGVDEDGTDHRLGLNLTYRVIAATLKYDKRIPLVREKEARLSKGYYDCDKDTVQHCKLKVAPGLPQGIPFRTIECYIMDLADDIAYSTYDLEDSFKAGFLNALDILSCGAELRARVANEVSRRLNERFTGDDVLEVLLQIFGQVISKDGKSEIDTTMRSFASAKELADVGYLRTDFTADLVSRFISGVEITINNDFPQLSKVTLTRDVLLQVEVAKIFTYEATIRSPRLKVTEHRGYQIVSNIFENLSSAKEALLLPDDFRQLHDRFREVPEKKRVICDFIAGMTDRYAIEFYARLNSELPQSIFKPF